RGARRRAWRAAERGRPAVLAALTARRLARRRDQLARPSRGGAHSRGNRDPGRCMGRDRGARRRALHGPRRSRARTVTAYWESFAPGEGRRAPRADAVTDARTISLNGTWAFRLSPTALGTGEAFIAD